MNKNLKLVINNIKDKRFEDKNFFERDELQTILDLYAKMVSEGSWRDYGLNISNKQVSFNVFKNATENALYRICKNFKPKNKNLKYFITDTNGKILKNSFELKRLLEDINWKKYNIDYVFESFNQGHGVNQENLKSFLDWLYKKY